jgi:protein SCO1/2
MSNLANSNFIFLRALLIIGIAFLTCVSGNLLAEEGNADIDPHAKHRAMMNKSPEDAASPVSVKIRDRVLVTQDGKSVHFADDVIAGRIVVMDFIYTTCTTVCPVLSTILGQVQIGLGERLGTEVHMVSVSVDPGRDTPERLKAYSESHKAKPGWLWLTGEKTEVDDVLRGLGAYTPDFEDHPSMVLVGDAGSGTWIRFFGFPGPDKIMAAVDELELARQVASTHQ